MKNKTKELNIESKETLEFWDLCVFTSTKYWEDKISKIRYPLFLKMIENCKNLWIKVIIADSSTNIDFLDNIDRTKKENIKIIKNDEQLWKKRREALKDGILDQNIKYFLWIEPEKYDLIKESSLNDMINELRLWETNIVVPYRKDIDQMPEFFAWIEKRWIKKVKEEILKSQEEYDLWFGPKMFDRKWAEYYINYNKRWDRADLWDSHINPVIEAYKDWLIIKSVYVDYTYDRSEIDIEWESKDLKQKRLDQYRSILSEILKS